MSENGAGGGGGAPSEAPVPVKQQEDGPDRTRKATRKPPAKAERTWKSRIEDPSAFWYHSQDTRREPEAVFTVYWACLDCRRTQSPAVNSGAESVRRVEGCWEPVKRDRQGKPVTPPNAYLSAFVCRFCNVKWDVTIERCAHE